MNARTAPLSQPPPHETEICLVFDTRTHVAYRYTPRGETTDTPRTTYLATLRRAGYHVARHVVVTGLAPLGNDHKSVLYCAFFIDQFCRERADNTLVVARCRAWVYMRVLADYVDAFVLRLTGVKGVALLDTVLNIDSLTVREPIGRMIPAAKTVWYVHRCAGVLLRGLEVVGEQAAQTSQLTKRRRSGLCALLYQGLVVYRGLY
jgi:hypothetical protein